MSNLKQILNFLFILIYILKCIECIEWQNNLAYGCEFKYSNNDDHTISKKEIKNCSEMCKVDKKCTHFNYKRLTTNDVCSFKTGIVSKYDAVSAVKTFMCGFYSEKMNVFPKENNTNYSPKCGKTFLTFLDEVIILISIF